MKTLKVMSIIGIVFSALCFMFVSTFANAVEYMASVGWGMYACMYLMAFSIVGLVQSKKYNE